MKYLLFLCGAVIPVCTALPFANGTLSLNKPNQDVPVAEETPAPESTGTPTVINMVIRLTTERPSGPTEFVQPVLAGQDAAITQPHYVVQVEPTRAAATSPEGGAPQGGAPALPADKAPQDIAAPSSPSSDSPKSEPEFDSPESQGSVKAGETCRLDEPRIILENKAEHAICFMVEFGANARKADLEHLENILKLRCGLGNGFDVPKNTTFEFCPGEGFNGALTSFHRAHAKEGKNQGSNLEPTRGSRHEFNFRPHETWFDIDYEFAVDSATLAPDQCANKDDIMGHKNITEVVHRAFHALTPLQQVEMQDTGYLVVDHGHVTGVRMDKNAPHRYMTWLQSGVGLRGYVNPGSVAGQHDAQYAKFGKVAVEEADAQTRVTPSKRLVITNY